MKIDYQLCTHDGPSLWQASQADNVVESADMLTLAYLWDTRKLHTIGKMVNARGERWAAAADLALCCLQGVAKRRPPSMRHLLEHHKFFNDNDGELHILESTGMPWSEFVQNQATALHAAIAGNDVKAVDDLLQKGGAHILMKSEGLHGGEILPLHRAVQSGSAGADSTSVAVLERLLHDDELPPST
eukprot:COSAG01_NODE_29473_length_636_cov_2.348231_1_plen_186_part_10